MAAWGIHFDECDGSLDFLGEVEDSGDWAIVEDRTRNYVAEGGYEDAEEALAAAELVAAALGRPSPRLKPDLADWAAKHAPAAQHLGPVAIEATKLVLDASELN